MRRARTWSVGITGAVLASALALAAGPTPTAHAAGITLQVSTVTDAPDANPGDGICASTLPGNPCTLRAAVQTANANPGFDSITIAPALEPPAPRPDPCVGPTFTLTVTGAGEDKAATGDLDVTGPTSIGDPCGFTVDGGHADRVWDISATMDVTNVITQNGLAVGADQRGSGFLVRNGASLAISGGRVAENGAAEPADGADGGGIYAGPGTSVQLTGAGVFGNKGDSGGGIWTAGELVLHTTDVMDGFASRGAGLYLADGATVDADHVQAGDSSAAVSGGVTYAATGSHATFTASIMANGSAPSGGVLYVEQGAVVGLVSSSISGGQSDGHGGGIFNDGEVTAYNGEFSGNQSVNDDGGAIYNGPTGRVEVERSFGNTNSANGSAQNGGFLYNLGTAVVVNTSIGHSSAENQGSGIWTSGPLDLSFSAITGGIGNTGPGVGLYVQAGTADVRVEDTVMADNFGAIAPHDCSGSVTLLGTVITELGGCTDSATQPGGGQAVSASMSTFVFLPDPTTYRVGDQQVPQLSSPSTNTDGQASSTDCQSVVVDGHGTSRLTGAEGTCDVGPLERSGSTRRCRSSHVPTTSRRPRRSPHSLSTRFRRVRSPVPSSRTTTRRPSHRRSPASTSALP